MASGATAAAAGIRCSARQEKHATISTSSTTAFMTLVQRCARSLSRMPRTSTTVVTTTPNSAMTSTWSAERRHERGDRLARHDGDGGDRRRRREPVVPADDEPGIRAERLAHEDVLPARARADRRELGDRVGPEQRVDAAEHPRAEEQAGRRQPRRDVRRRAQDPRADHPARHPPRSRTTLPATAAAGWPDGHLGQRPPSSSRQELVQQRMEVMHAVLALRRVAAAVVDARAEVALHDLADLDVLVLDLVAEREELRPRRVARRVGRRMRRRTTRTPPCMRSWPSGSTTFVCICPR